MNVAVRAIRQQQQLLLKYLMLLVLFHAFSAGTAQVQNYPLKQVPQLTRLVDYEASWSPDSRQIILISNRHGCMKLHILNANSANQG